MLKQLLQESSPGLVASTLPAKPTPFLQTSCAVEQPLISHLCRLWDEAGFSDREWDQALRLFEAELFKQRQKRSAVPAETSDQNEGRWTLETFSVWLMGRGRLLRECSQWFHAFDFDQDDMIGVADFLQGVAVAGSPRPPGPNTIGSLCVALALFRLLDLEKRQSLDVRDLESILEDAQVTLGVDFPLSLVQVAQRATNFEFFRTMLLPRLQGASTFKLLVFE
eukprot:NODE_6543_length_1662_cov_8.423453.p3 GENE.NODE_6543_length_1662_cov_8.423453~~NODE_6543_length_1662_cov_8.423453.p3  ORF type:complete len:223 (-),score=58.98 NODE_6543_length_1662_cov_8.423453:229-897(-)